MQVNLEAYMFCVCMTYTSISIVRITTARTNEFQLFCVFAYTAAALIISLTG